MDEKTKQRTGLITLGVVGSVFIILKLVVGSVFIILKLFKLISWNWWWVTLPFWGIPGLVFAFMLFMLVVSLFINQQKDLF